MTTLEAVVFGAMLAWTPSLIVLAASLWEVLEIEGMELAPRLVNSSRSHFPA
jgi:hypothetical protein